jgi:hypothetical protein
MRDINERAITRNNFRFVSIERERDGQGWLVLAQQHGWLHGSQASALQDAQEIARGFDVFVEVRL